ncbi:TetR/AcrR family transcriptional regulator [Solitalea lacus]|uniref:TetR/AcrR family transcriptional regulator n=1 Tax=Solitalea lacus TaxID=2911172 RepID=UPI001EDB8C5C|nr:TetR/AcrR family transcriptional regulator [Solitalea lacus]UKJ06597.1 TetR/AcrR family transcriptional regulator [Solitalea lacus]
MGKQIQKPDHSTEEKIKAAAQKLFTQKGYAATKTRDIATEADINLALLNYYFRSKAALFELIMADHFQQFIQGAVAVLNQEQTSFKEKIERLINYYIDMLIRQPDMPLFVLSELRNGPENLILKMGIKTHIKESLFLKQFNQAKQNGEIANIHHLHLLSNMLGLTIFPFIVNPIIKDINDIDQQEFNAFMLERKKLIPLWIEAILKPQTQQ